jgi:hypothetical protein
VARGETLFNTKPIAIRDAGGLNDDLGVEVIPGTCTTCHDTPNAGNHSVPAPLRIGTADVHPVGGLDASGLPVYTLRNKTTGETVQTTDPGRALITGKWKDISRFKGPTLRGLASRAPYFHNGSARFAEDRGRVLRHPVRDRAHPGREEGPGRLPPDAVAAPPGRYAAARVPLRPAAAFFGLDRL